MTVTSRTFMSVGLALTVASLTGAVVPAQTQQSAVSRERRQARCFSDEGTVRACLVPDPVLEGRQNIRIGNSSCYWLKEDEKEKKKRYKRSANGRPRQFGFQVINLCSEKVDVRLDLALAGDLKFQTARCEAPVAGAPTGPYIPVPLGSIEPQREAVATCDTLPYEGKWWFFGRTLRREFRLAATAYGGTPLGQEIYFDPEVVLEKAGH